MHQQRRTPDALRRGCVRVVLATFVLAGVASSCARRESRQGSDTRIALDTSRGADSAIVVVSGLSSDELAEWRRRPETAAESTTHYRVVVAGNESSALAGRYAVSDSAVEFRPRFPLDHGRKYNVSFTRGDSTVRASIGLPVRRLDATTRVTRVLPNLALVPENQLRLYIEFSAPMSNEAGLPFVHLRTARGDSVGNAFLPVDGDFWNPEHTRYTIFLDPGRVKRGILPNEQMGRPLENGAQYVLRVDSTWRDARGARLASAFEYRFRAGPAELQPITLAQWSVVAAKVDTRAPVMVRFPKPLDHGLLRRALGVESSGGKLVEGRVDIDAGERAWRFTPDTPWRAGDYRLVVLSILEDLAGNRINRPFEADRFDSVDSTAKTPRFTIPFVIR